MRKSKNDFIIKGDIVEIIVYKKNGNTIKSVIDLKDYNSVKLHSWSDTNGYLETKINNKHVKLHRFIMQLDNNSNNVIDHISGNTLDNRRLNLRICKSYENSRNRRKNLNNESGFPGVVWCKANKKWRSKICVNRKTIHLGYFNNIKDAIITRTKAEKKYFGEFAPPKNSFIKSY